MRCTDVDSLVRSVGYTSGSGGGSSFSVEGTATKVNIYMQFLLYSVVALAFVKAVGSTLYMVRHCTGQSSARIEADVRTKDRADLRASSSIYTQIFWLFQG